MLNYIRKLLSRKRQGQLSALRLQDNSLELTLTGADGDRWVTVIPEIHANTFAKWMHYEYLKGNENVPSTNKKALPPVLSLLRGTGGTVRNIRPTGK